MDTIDSLLASLRTYPSLMTILQLTTLILVVWLANMIARTLLVRAISRTAKLAPTQWDSALLGRGVIARLANVVPALADIFDHLYAILPEFGLRVFQQPSGEDLRRIVAEWREPAQA